MSNAKKLSSLEKYLSKRQNFFVLLAEKTLWLIKLPSVIQDADARKIGISTTPHQEALALYQKAEEETKLVLRDFAGCAPDAVQATLKKAYLPRPIRIGVASVIDEIQSFIFTLGEVEASVKQAILQEKLFPRQSEFKVQIAEGMFASPGFRSVKKGREVYVLTEIEGRVIQRLCLALREGLAEVSLDEILLYVNGNPSSYLRLRDAFQSKDSMKAYKALIKRGSKKDMYRLNTDLPTDLPLSA